MSKRGRTILRKRTINALKRLSAVVVAVSVVLGQLPVFSAFEAHVINVTARIVPRCDDIVITGTKFEDKNGNGMQDAGEPGLNDWIIELKRGPFAPEFDYNGNSQNDSNDYGVLQGVIVDGATCPLGTQCDFNGDGSLALASMDLAAFQNWLASRDLGNQITDESGHYAFHNLTFGTYIIAETLQTGWTPTTELRRTVTVDACTVTVNFGNRQQENLKGSLSGYKWNDMNRDGTWQQPSEPPISGWLIALTGDASGSATTDASGYYAFTNLNAGNYTVTEEIRSDWFLSTPTSTTVTLATGENKGNLNFGNYRTLCENAITLDFERTPSGVPMLKGQFIDNEYSPWGIIVKAHNYNAAHPQVAIIFDSANPSGGIHGDQIVDVDLGTPNKQFGGPGDSENGSGFEPSNNVALHNLLTIPDNVVDTNPVDGNVDDPNDEPAGGSISFIFDSPYAFASVKYVDLDHGSGEVVGYADATATSQLFSIPVLVKNGNAVQKISGDQTTQIKTLKLRGRDSFAIDEVVVCPSPPPPPVCSDGKVNQSFEQCDDGNLVNGDGCENTCTPTTWCGDGILQTPNSYGQNEACDEGEQNGTTESTCTTLCTMQQNQCAALSPGYYKNNDGCQNGIGSSIWAAQVNTLSDSFFDVFATIDGSGTCVQFAVNCTTSTSNDVDKARCNAKKHLLADETNAVANHLRPDALVAGGYDGNAAFGSLGIYATSTIQQAMVAIEQVIANPGSTKEQLTRAQYVAARLYTFYENENPDPSECVLPGIGNGIIETGEQCDDGNLSPWDGCSPSGQSEVVLNEIMVNPNGADNALMPGGEWVELFNNSAKPISLQEWALYDSSDSHVLQITATSTDLATTTIAAGGRLVVYRNGNVNFALFESHDSVRLYNARIQQGGNLLDAFSWTTSKPEGNTYQRVPDGTGAWVDPCPTPGEANTADESCGSTETVTGKFELVAPAAEEEPKDEVLAVPDAAYLTDTQWNALFPEQDYPETEETPVIKSSEGKAEEVITDPMVVVQPADGSDPPDDPNASVSTTTPEITATGAGSGT